MGIILQVRCREKDRWRGRGSSLCNRWEMATNFHSSTLQAVLAKNYPKVRKGLYVFPINWCACVFCACIFVFVCMCTCMCVCVFAYSLSTSVYVCLCLFILCMCICICVYVYMCV